MTTRIKEEQEFNDKFAELIKRGCEIIPEYLHTEWKNFVNRYHEIDPSDINDYFEECFIITSYLMDFKTLKDGRLVADKFYEQFNYKSNYSKRLASTVALFARYPANIQFLQRYYEDFHDIMVEEERALTSKIDELKKINSLIKAGANYDEAKHLNKARTKTIDINGQIIFLIEEDKELYYGINDDNEFVIYKCIDDEFDVVYLIREDDTYIRLISRRQRFERGNMYSGKTLTTDHNNNILSVDYNEILEKLSFNSMEGIVSYYQRIIKYTMSSNNRGILNAIKETLELANIIDEDNHKLVANIFDKMAKEVENEKTPTP